VLVAPAAFSFGQKVKVDREGAAARFHAVRRCNDRLRVIAPLRLFGAGFCKARLCRPDPLLQRPLEEGDDGPPS
jgi:hypothetical protein